MDNRIKEEVIKIKEHLLSLAPEATGVDIDLGEEKLGLFKSKIRVKLPRRKSLLAYKKGQDPYTTLDKGHQAILRQLEKEKNKMRKKSTLPIAS